MLAASVQAAIDTGKDVSESEPATDGRKKDRIYRKTVPFSHDEALQIALDALQAYFVEQPMFVSSSADNLAKSAIGVPQKGLQNWRVDGIEANESLSLEGIDQEKAVEIELQTATQISRIGEETIPLKRISREQIEQQHKQIIELRKLADFAEE